jgi:uridine kinase
MSLEIERTFRVNPSLLPDLSSFPYIDIDQNYLSPYPHDPNYPEIENAELRIRSETNQQGKVTYTATAKFGDKSKGQRIEIETEIEPSDFGTDPEDIAQYGNGRVTKRRFLMGDELVVDQYDQSLFGKLIVAEKEFTDMTEFDEWEIPEWAIEDATIPSNRKLAKKLGSSPINDSVKTTEIEHIKLFIELLYRKYGSVIITLSGMSGSGKSTIAVELADNLGATLINTDNFHIGTAQLYERFGIVNHDTPTTYDYSEAAIAAKKIILGNTVIIPTYDFETAERSNEQKILSPAARKIVILEGLYAWSAAELPNSSSDLIPYLNALVDTPLYACILRRLCRDSSFQKGEYERSIPWTAEESLKYILSTAIPHFRRYTPDNAFFDVII